MPAMTYVYAGGLFIVNTLGLLLVAVGLPGTWLMVIATAGLAWWRWEERMFSPWTVAALAALALLGEIAEFAAGAAGSRKAGGSLRGAAGALVFGVVGGIAGTFLIPIPLVGSVLGACLGAGAGAILGELSLGKKLEPAVTVGKGAFVGRFLGTVYKLAAGGAIWVAATAASVAR